MYLYVCPSPLGPLYLLAAPEGLQALLCEGMSPQYYGLPAYSCCCRISDTAGFPPLEATLRWLEIYFRGCDPGFRPALSLQGTDFQKAVWEETQRVAYGESISYGELARRVAHRFHRKQMSPQAVGHALHRNPALLVVPCHRVLAAKGRIGDFAGELWRKRLLLKNEGIPFSEK